MARTFYHQTRLLLLLIYYYYYFSNQLLLNYYQYIHKFSGMICCSANLVSMPLAKVIPVVNGQMNFVLSDAPNPFLQVRLK